MLTSKNKNPGSQIQYSKIAFVYIFMRKISQQENFVEDIIYHIKCEKCLI